MDATELYDVGRLVLAYLVVGVWGCAFGAAWLLVVGWVVRLVGAAWRRVFNGRA